MTTKELQKVNNSCLGVYFLIPLIWLLLFFVLWELGYISDVIFAMTLIADAIIIMGIIISIQIYKLSVVINYKK